MAFATPPSRAPAAGARVVSPVLYTGMHWRNIGPFRGGRALAVMGVTGDPNRFYFGAVGGGVWTTGNAGRTWTPLFDKEPVSSIGALAVAPSDPKTLYVGTGESDMRSDIIAGNGMYASSDAGRTWRHIGLTGSRQIARIVVDPHDPSVVYVAALGDAYGPSTERGVFKSRNGGASWQRILFANADTGAVDLALDPHDSRILFASLWQTRRPPWSVYPPSNGPGSGLYKSSDAGATWSHVGGLPVEGLGKIGIAIAASHARRMYAIVDAKRGGLYRSDDAGASWTLVDREARIWGRGWYFSHVAVDPQNADRVYVSNTSLYRSDDGGASFTAIKGAPGGDDYHMLWIDPAAPERMILAGDQGVVVSVDGATTWSSWYNQPTAQLYHVATDGAFPYRIYGAQQDSGALTIESRSSGRGISSRDWSPLAVGGESDYIAPDPLDDNIVYGGRVEREDLRTHITANRSPTLAAPSLWRSAWTSPLVFSQADPHRLYFGHQRVFETSDGGASWRTISPDLTRPSPGIPRTLDAPTVADREHGPPRGVVYTLAPSPLRADLLWAGTDDGLIRLTRDDGGTWSDVTPPGLGAWSKVALIEASHFDPREAYAVVDRHRLADDTPYLYRTRDLGRTWRLATRGIANGTFINAVREDPARRGLLYAGTEMGVYVSFDDGDSWQSLQLDLPACSVRDLAIRNDDLVIATHGRSFWILDDLAPLRQATETTGGTQPVLFGPADVFRLRPGDDEGTPLPPETPQGENPPQGASLDYVLRAAPGAPVVLEIFDAGGRRVRRYSSDDVVRPVDPATLDIPAHWVETVRPPPASPGMHRVRWDLQDTAGTWVAPGRYTVRLTVDGLPLTRSFEVRPDPRGSASVDDLRAQYAFADEVKTLLAQVTAVYDAADKRRANERELEPLRQSRDALEGIYTAVESGDARPSVAQVQAFHAQSLIARHLLGGGAAK